MIRNLAIATMSIGLATCGEAAQTSTQTDPAQPTGNSQEPVGNSVTEPPGTTHPASGPEATTIDAVATPQSSQPYYVDETGSGVLRYSAADGVARQYAVSIETLPPASRPDGRREVLNGGMPFAASPHVAVWHEQLTLLETQSNIPLGSVRFVVYAQEPSSDRVEFRIVIDPNKAEPLAGCGEILNIAGECANKVPTQ